MTDIFICEDEKEQLRYLENIIDTYVGENGIEANVVSARSNPEEILGDIVINSGNTMLFFIDVQLNGYAMDGFTLARRLKALGKDCQFVFLTSRDDQAYKVFEHELDVLDYIVKEPEYFLTEKINEGLGRRFDRIFVKIDNFKNIEKKDMLIVECGSRLIEIRLEEISYIQAVKGRHQVEIVTVNRKVSTRQPLKSIFQCLNDNFIYVNKSCIVNRNKVIEVDKRSRYVTLEDGFQCEVSFREMQKICAEFAEIVGNGKVL